MTILPQSQIASIAQQAGFNANNAKIASAIAMAESGGDTNSYNPEIASGTPPGSGSRGLWQIYGKAHPQYNNDSLYDPLTNARAAYVVSSGGTNWNPWSTYGSGAYKRYLNGLSPISSVIAPTGTDVYYPSGQCTWYASFRYHQLTGKWVMPTWGDAHSWSANAAANGWIVDTKPMLPSIICLQANIQGAGSLGHVAIVDSVNLDGSVSTSGLNWAGNQSTPTKVTFRPGGGVTFIAYPGIGNNASGASTNQIGAALASIAQMFNITTVSAQANQLVNTIPGFLGVCEAMDKIEQFVPFQLPATASAAAGNTGVPGVTANTSTIDIFGWNIDVPTGFTLASPQQIAQLPSDAIQAILVFTTTNFMAFAIRSIFVLAGIILFAALTINVISSVVDVKDAVGVAEKVGMLAV